MNPEYQRQAQRLQNLRISQRSRQQATPFSYPVALNSSVGSSSSGSGQDTQDEFTASSVPMGQYDENQSPKDPLIYPGLYAPSGFDIMDILVKVHTRPNPTIQIGNVDHSVALTLCDCNAPDMPIVYCSEPFESLTGYSLPEIIGRNCRFLQHPPQELASVEGRLEDAKINNIARRELRQRFLNHEEARVEFVNYTKGGKRFLNILTTIPISWGGDRQYMVGFQADAKGAFVSR